MICVIFFFINFAESEWVEIAPIVNAKNFSVSTPPTFFQTTLPTNEFIMRSPISKTSESSTSSYGTYKELGITEFENVEENKYLNQTLSKENIFNEIIEDAPYNSFYSVLQEVQQNLLESTSRESKISVLTNLRDLLLSNLYTRISKLWKPQLQEKNEARGYKDDHEMEFPSNEGALMTIGFLTFAVFLIKLVIKLVQALKYKYLYYGTTTTTTAATVLLLKRKKREELDEATTRINTYIEKLPY